MFYGPLGDQRDNFKWILNSSPLPHQAHIFDVLKYKFEKKKKKRVLG